MELETATRIPRAERRGQGNEKQPQARRMARVRDRMGIGMQCTGGTPVRSADAQRIFSRNESRPGQTADLPAPYCNWDAWGVSPITHVGFAGIGNDSDPDYGLGWRYTNSTCCIPVMPGVSP